MAKKTGRAARVQQNSRLQETKRDVSARPITTTPNTNPFSHNNGGNGRTAVASEPFKISIGADDLADKSSAIPPMNTAETPAAVAPLNNISVPTHPTVVPVSSTTVRHGTLPPRRFLNAQPRQNPVISREEEYRFIRADLVTVLVLAILMIIALVVLTVIIGR